jgi:molybdenum cofactor biosynthesis enzyme MoaA
MGLRAGESQGQWTCDYLETGLVISRGRIDACCVTHHRNLGHVILVENFDGDYFPLEEIIEARRRILAQLRQPDGYPACRGCVKLVKRKAPKQKYAFDYIVFAHHTHCNLRCRYCHSTEPGFRHVERPPNVLPLIKDLVRRRLLSPNCEIGWSGGEPTLLDEFDELSSYLAAIGARQNLHTNAVLLSRAAMHWIPKSLYRMYISVDAGTRGTYQLLKGADAFEQVWANIARYISVGGRRVLPKMILMKENLAEVAQFVALSHRAGAWTVVCDLNNKEEHLDDDVVHAAVIMLEECARRGIRMVVGMNTHHAWPEKHFDIRVKGLYEDMVRQMAFPQRLRQRIGTAKALRHVLRIGAALQR